MEKPRSSLSMRLSALPTVSSVLPSRASRLTPKVSSSSMWPSPDTRTVTWALVWPSANCRVPDGRPPFAPRASWPLMKSARLAASTPCPTATFQSTLVARRSPARVTVKVKLRSWPASPSAALAWSATMDRPTSSLRTRVLALPVSSWVWSWAGFSAGLPRVRVRVSSLSSTASPARVSSITLLVSPAANCTRPLRAVPAEKSSACRPLAVQVTLTGPDRSPLRVTVKRSTWVSPVAPSATSACCAWMRMPTSSETMLPWAWPVRISAWPLALPRVTVKASSPSTSRSPRTATWITLLVSPGAKVRVPAGSTPPAKSAASTWPERLQSTVVVPLVTPERVTVNSWMTLPLSPSTRPLRVVAMARPVSSLVTLADAEAVPRLEPVAGS